MLTIQDVAVRLDGTTGPTPLGSAVVSFAPTLTPLFASLAGTFREVSRAAFTVLSDAITGAWTASLPWPSESDPSTVRWQITTPDGDTFVGQVPEGVAGPVSLHDLKVSHGWALVAVRQAAVLAIQGETGAQGPLLRYANATRPAASSVPYLMIFNTDDNAPNWSDGTNWRDAVGNIV